MQINIEPIQKNFDLRSFDCGINNLNTYLSRFAAVNDRKNISKTFIAFHTENRDKILGYYSVSMAQILFTDMPDNLKKGLPKYPVPAMRIGKLAVDISKQNKGLGAILLKDALMRAVNISSEIAVHCVVVDSYNETAKEFYLKYGFIPFQEHPLTLVLPIHTIISAI